MSTKKVDVGGKSISFQQKKLMLDKKGISFRQKQDEVAQKNIFQKNYYFFFRTMRYIKLCEKKVIDLKCRNFDERNKVFHSKNDVI